MGGKLSPSKLFSEKCQEGTPKRRKTHKLVLLDWAIVFPVMGPLVARRTFENVWVILSKLEKQSENLRAANFGDSMERVPSKKKIRFEFASTFFLEENKPESQTVTRNKQWAEKRISWFLKLTYPISCTKFKNSWLEKGLRKKKGMFT